MAAERGRLIVPAFITAALVLALDQWSKRLVVQGLGPEAATNRIDLAGRWLALEYAENRGIAFGLFGAQPLAVGLVALAVLGFVVAHAVRQHRTSWLLALGTGLTAGGALGNLLDRARLGYVVDFIAVGIWPNFNVADAAICIGVACLAVDALLAPNPPEPATGAQP